MQVIVKSKILNIEKISKSIDSKNISIYGFNKDFSYGWEHKFSKHLSLLKIKGKINLIKLLSKNDKNSENINKKIISISDLSIYLINNTEDYIKINNSSTGNFIVVNIADFDNDREEVINYLIRKVFDLY